MNIIIIFILICIPVGIYLFSQTEISNEEYVDAYQRCKGHPAVGHLYCKAIQKGKITKWEEFVMFNKRFAYDKKKRNTDLTDKVKRIKKEKCD